MAEQDKVAKFKISNRKHFRAGRWFGEGSTLPMIPTEKDFPNKDWEPLNAAAQASYDKHHPEGPWSTKNRPPPAGEEPVAQNDGGKPALRDLPILDGPKAPLVGDGKGSKKRASDLDV